MLLGRRPPVLAVLPRRRSGAIARRSAGRSARCNGADIVVVVVVVVRCCVRRGARGRERGMEGLVMASEHRKGGEASKEEGRR